ncbi:TIGR04222 domain-containing membrane protein [Streptomyces sp. A3M-1-3]|uniref:TIGR04222 domain-containing membrane protein n=1 Tax=Streptomyces sp. A3M-1-3 TaxID=2962044 RepID=UPI0020B8079A|nr:TIGR04222 domain-containing membrane protein [Streptomyces sp. A3M-1-3]MCP3820905.1 TIGR04222 domain-containing membrane protein [Streptomyces sp. A3M-1-3]
MNVVAVLCYLALGASSVALIAGLAGARRNGPSGGHVHDVMEGAFLAGGPARVVDTAIVAMATDGRLSIGGPGIVSVHPYSAVREPVERAVLDAHAEAPSGALHTLRFAVMRSPAVQEIGDGLAARGLMAAPRENRKWRIWGLAQAVGCFLGFPLAFVLTIVQFVDEDPFDAGFPFIVLVAPALIGGAVTGAVCAGIAKSRITRAGQQALREYRTAQAYATHPAVLVGTQGLGALPDPLLRAQLVAAARERRAAARSTGGDDAAAGVVVWCAASSPGGGGGCGGGGGGRGGGSSCSSGSSCGSGSSGSSGSSCSSSSGSSCSSSS